MTLTARSFVLAAVLAAIPTASFADGRDRYAPVQSPAPSPYPGDRDGRADDRDDRFDRDGRDGRDGRFDRDGSYDRFDRGVRDDRFERWCGHDRLRMAGQGFWRRAEWRDLRRDFWELERQRDAFYAYGWHHPRESRRFERWYAARRFELERRRDILVSNAYAWR